uniref:hypothetical protein n=1 Tax=Acetatifactor sp. TaxID=1872090 RepID=UPI0040579B93
MGKRFQISILENIKDYDRELIYDAKNLPLEQVYSKCEEDEFFIKLKVKSVYASTEDIVKYIRQKYSLTEEKYDFLAYSSSGGMVLRIANNSYDISDIEVDRIKSEHIDGLLYCKKYGSYEMESVMGLSPSTIIEKDFEYIDDELINKIIVALNVELREVSIETLSNTLEDCIYTKGDKLVEALLMAKVLAEKIGGKAILELI